MRITGVCACAGESRGCWAGEMAAPGESGASAGGGSTEEAFMTFYSEVNTQ